jgi:tetratricopeptide (TPR) repeat protein
MQFVAEGNSALVNEDYEAAVDIFGRAIEQDSGIVVAFTGRCAAFLKLGRHREALQDASVAQSKDPMNEVAYYREGQAAFALEEYYRAQTAFEKGRSLCAKADTQKDKKYKTWLRKCAAEMGSKQHSVHKEEPMVCALAKFQYYQTLEHITISILRKGLCEKDVRIDLSPCKLRVVAKEEAEVVIFDKNFYDNIVPEKSEFKYLPSKVREHLSNC